MNFIQICDTRVNKMQYYGTNCKKNFLKRSLVDFYIDLMIFLILYVGTEENPDDVI